MDPLAINCPLCVADRAVYLLAKHRLDQRTLAMPEVTVVTEIDPATC